MRSVSFVRRPYLFFAALLALAGLSGPARADPSPAARPDKLVIGLLPGESAPTVMRLNEPLRAYLEKRLKLPVEMVVGANYAATGEALRFGRRDIAYLGPVTYILQSRRAKTRDPATHCAARGCPASASCAFPSGRRSCRGWWTSPSTAGSTTCDQRPRSE